MEEIDLYDMLRFFVKKWLTIVTFVMIGAIAGIGYTYFLQTPEYTSKAQLLLVGNTRSSASDSVVINNYVQLFSSNRVLGHVANEQNYDKGYEALAEQTTAENVKNTDIINVAISTTDAKQSQAILETAIETFSQQAKTLYGDNNIKINVVDGASLPSSPSNVKPVVQIGIATIVGLVLAVVSLFFVYDYRMSRLQKLSSMTADKSAKAQAKVKMSTPKAPKEQKSKVGRSVKKLLMGEEDQQIQDTANKQ